MALTVTTLRPNSTTQLGSAGNTVVGAGSAHDALADSTDTTYVRLGARCRTDGEVARVGFPTPTLPAGAKVVSVGLRRRVMTVPEGQPRPVSLHWFRVLVGAVLIAGQRQQPKKDLFTSLCPTHPVGGTWVEESLGSRTTTATGDAWDPATNLAGFTYDLGRGDDTDGDLRVSAVYLDVTWQAVSQVTATGPNGTTATTRPVVSWTYTSPDSQPQQGYRVVIYTAAQTGAVGFVPFETTPLQDSGDLLGEDLQWIPTVDLPDGSYVAYVRATSKWSGPGEFPTNTSSASWTRAVAGGGSLPDGGTQPPAVQPPDADLVAATFDPINDRVALTIAPSSVSPATAAFTVQVSRDNGVTWSSPDSLSFQPANGTTPIVLYDYLAPISATSRYRVLAYSQSGGQYVAAEAVSNERSVTTFGQTWRLADPANPLNNCVVIPVRGVDGRHDEITFPRQSATFQPVTGAGERPPIVVTGPTSGEAGTLNLLFVGEQLDNWPAFRQAMQSGHTVLLKKAHSEQLWVRLAAGPGTQDPKLTYDVVPGRLDVVYWRKITVPYTQTVPPSTY